MKKAGADPFRAGFFAPYPALVHCASSGRFLPDTKRNERD